MMPLHNSGLTISQMMKLWSEQEHKKNQKGPRTPNPRTNLVAMHKRIWREKCNQHRRYIDGDPTKGVRPEIGSK